MEIWLIVLGVVLTLSGLLNIFQTYRIVTRDREMDELVEETNKRLESSANAFREVIIETRRESDFKLQQISKQVGRAISALPIAKGTKSTIIVRMEEIISTEIQRGFECDYN